MEALEMNRKTFTFNWKIKNFRFSWHRESDCIASPPFQVLTRDPVQWQLILFPNKLSKFIFCACTEISLPTRLGYELAFLSPNGSTLISVEDPDADFKNTHVFLSVHRDTVFGEERAAFLPNDTLTIQCKIWEVEDSILETYRCFAETEIEVERKSTIWTIKRFSSIKEGQRIFRTRFLTTATKPRFKFSFLLKDGIYVIGINPLNTKSVKVCKSKVFFLDATGERIRWGWHEFPSTVANESLFQLQYILMKNKSRYLPNDDLTLQFEMEFSTGVETGKILETDSPIDLLEVTNSVTTNNFLYSVEHNSDNILHSVENDTDNILQPIENDTVSSLSWKDDLLFIFMNSLICDTVLKTSSKSFAVHSLILRIRSPVFSDMLSVDDCKVLKDGIYIEDLDANTVGKMVLYLYTDTLDDLDWESAKNLYCASNKYEITSLKQVCASFLEKNLEPVNSCDILCMADRYEDYGLISAVQCFISKHTEEILVSDAWINLEENNFLLANKTLRKLCLKN